MTKNAKSLRSAAERACEWYARDLLSCVITRRAVQTRFQSVDFFAADCVGKRSDGSHVYIQATAGQYEAVRTRRRKLEAVPWHESDTVLLLQLVQTEDPANARRKKYFFRVHRLINGDWSVQEDAHEIPREWFKAWKGNDNAN